MADSKGSETTTPAVITRRDAIVGALALAAGTLLASKPDAALAANGDFMHVGTAMDSTTFTSITRHDPSLIGIDEVSYVFLNHNLGDQQVGLYGAVTDRSALDSLGIYGLASVTGQCAVQAENIDGGTALRVLGKTEFARSGTGTVTKGHSTKTVTVYSGVATTSRILVTLQGDGGSGVYLKYAARSGASSFKVVLTKAAAKSVKFAWMITD
jgi:hypothetical protein